MGFFKSIKKGFKKITSGIKKLFKKLTFSTFGKILLAAAVIYVGVAAYQAAQAAQTAAAAGQVVGTGTTTALEATAAGSAELSGAVSAAEASLTQSLGTVGAAGTPGVSIGGAVAPTAIPTAGGITGTGVTPAAAAQFGGAPTAISPSVSLAETVAAQEAGLASSLTEAGVSTLGAETAAPTLLGKIMGGLSAAGEFAAENKLLTYGALQGVSGMFTESAADAERARAKAERDRIERAFSGMGDIDIRGVSDRPRVRAMPATGSVLQRYAGAV